MTGLPICIVARDVEVPLAPDVARIRTVDSLAQMHAELVALASNAFTGTRSLDLIGHSTREHQFLRIGQTGIDMYRRSIAAVFEAIAAERLFATLGVTALRLLGCSTASSPSGQRTIRRLSHVLGVPVYGSTKALLPAHYTAECFNSKFDSILVEA